MKDKDWKFKTGLILIIISIILFIIFPFIPFFDLEKKRIIILSTITLVTAEVMFYTGGLLIGKQLFKKYKSYLNPKNWFRKKPAVPREITDKESELI